MTTELPYDRRRTPPAPVLPLRVGPPGGEPTVAVVALVDTGADMSVLPESVPTSLALPTIGEITVRGVGGTARRVSLYAAQVEGAGTKRIIEAAAIGAEALVGRDLLNAWVVTLDGPRGLLRIETPEPPAAFRQASSEHPRNRA